MMKKKKTALKTVALKRCSSYEMGFVPLLCNQESSKNHKK